MRPTGLCSNGFLGKKESLIEVLQKDQATLEKAGVTCEVVADLLAVISTDANAPREYDVKVNGKQYHVKKMEWRGHVECPYGCGFDGGAYRTDVHEAGFDKEFDWRRDVHQRGSTDYIVTSPGAAESISFPGLLIHLIRAHHFFEGEGTPFRTSPESIIRFFGLESGKKAEVEIVRTKEFMAGLLANRLSSLRIDFNFMLWDSSNRQALLDRALGRVREFIDKGLLEGIDRPVLERFYQELTAKLPGSIYLERDSFESLLDSVFRPLWVIVRQTYGN